MTRYDNDTDQAIIHIQTIQNVLGQDVKIYLLIVHIQLSDLPESRLKLWEHVRFRMDCFQFLPEHTLSGLCRNCCGCGQ